VKIYQKIFEAKGSSTLFHGTSVENAINILKENKLKGNALGRICFARVLSSDFYKTHGDCIFEIDKQKFDLYQSKNCYIEPYVDPDFGKEEAEERVTFRRGKEFDNFIFYIKKVIVNIYLNISYGSKEAEEFLELEKLLSENNIKYEVRTNLFKKTNLTLFDAAAYAQEFEDLFGKNIRLVGNILFDLTKEHSERRINDYSIKKIGMYTPRINGAIKKIVENDIILDQKLFSTNSPTVPEIFLAVYHYLDDKEWPFIKKILGEIK
jgi:hypothetical protein